MNIERRDLILAFSVAFVFSLLVILIPVYDLTNGLHNVFLDNYNLTWSDGRSPINFYVIKNLINGKGIGFSGDFVFRDVAAKNNYDMYEKNGLYFPVFNLRSVYLFSTILLPFRFLSDLLLYKAILIVEMAFYSASVFIFYFIQRRLGLNQTLCFFSSLGASLTTSVFIYSHYLFLDGAVLTFFFFTFLLSVLHFWNKKSKIASYIIPSTFAIFFFFFVVSFWIFWLFNFVILYFTYFRKKVFTSLKIFLVIAIFVSFISYFVNVLVEIGLENLTKLDGYNSISLFKIFPNFITADDYSIYGSHDATTQTRLFSYFYGFNQSPGNAIFFHSIGFFGSLFGEKGFVYNSPFLIFSIFGILSFKDKDKRNFLAVMTLLFIILLSARFEWYGGVIPRYVRHFDIPILLLSFFSFYFVQESKNKIIMLIFIILLAVSFLNVASLAVRMDWTYEQHSQLVSYDLVLWPFSQNVSYPTGTPLITSRKLLHKQFLQASRPFYSGFY